MRHSSLGKASEPVRATSPAGLPRRSALQTIAIGRLCSETVQHIWRRTQRETSGCPAGPWYCSPRVSVAASQELQPYAMHFQSANRRSVGRARIALISPLMVPLCFELQQALPRRSPACWLKALFSDGRQLDLPHLHVEVLSLEEGKAALGSPTVAVVGNPCQLGHFANQ